MSANEENILINLDLGIPMFVVGGQYKAKAEAEENLCGSLPGFTKTETKLLKREKIKSYSEGILLHFLNVIKVHYGGVIWWNLQEFGRRIMCFRRNERIFCLYSCLM